MKVLIIDTTKFEYNGMTNVILNYYKAMDKSDMKIDMVIINEPEDSIKKELQKERTNIFVLEERLTGTITYIKKLRKILKDNKYDVMHVHGNSATMAVEMIAGVMTHTKVRIAHSHSTTCMYMKVHKILKPIFELTCTHCFACGDAAGKWLFGKRKFVVINNGIDDERFAYNEKRRITCRKEMCLDDKYVIGHVGEFTYAKNHDTLIDIFMEVQKTRKDAVLMLVGDGELRDTIERKVQKLNISSKVIFTGRTTDVAKYMQAMDVFVLPSRFEGLPLVLVEAQAAALRCVASCNVSNEVNITGLVKFISTDNKEEFAKEILNENSENRKSVSKRANKVLKEQGYSIKENAKEMKELYAGMVS